MQSCCTHVHSININLRCRPNTFLLDKQLIVWPPKKEQCFVLISFTSQFVFKKTIPQKYYQKKSPKPNKTATYWKSNYSHICLRGFNKEVHPEIHKFLFGRMLLWSQFLKMLMYQNSLYNRLQVPETIQTYTHNKFSTVCKLQCLYL